MLYPAVLSSVSDLTASTLALAKAVQTFNTRLWDRATEQQLDAVALHVDAGVKQLRLLGEVQGIADFIAGQVQLAQEYAERLGEYVRLGFSTLAMTQQELEVLAKTPLSSLAVASEFSAHPAPGTDAAASTESPPDW